MERRKPKGISTLTTIGILLTMLFKTSETLMCQRSLLPVAKRGGENHFFHQAKVMLEARACSADNSRTIAPCNRPLKTIQLAKEL